MIGTLLNTLSVIVGSLLGAALGARLNERIRGTVMDGLALVVVLVGLQSSLTTHNVLLILASIVLGGALGAFADIEGRLDGLSRLLERRLNRTRADADTGVPTTFSQGFVTASLVFCVGPMSILGSIQDGLSGDIRTLAVKSLLDFVSAIAFASTLGWSVMLAAVTVLVYQGGLSLLAGSARAWLTDPMIREMTAAGGILIMGIGIRLLGLKAVPVGNLLPSIVLAPWLQGVAGDLLERLLQQSTP